MQYEPPNKHALLLHAVQRCSQRGISPGDIDLIRMLGTHVPDGLLVRRKDAEEFARYWRKQADCAERLAGTRMVICEDSVLTVYHATATKTRNLLRRTAERDLYY